MPERIIPIVLEPVDSKSEVFPSSLRRSNAGPRSRNGFVMHVSTLAVWVVPLALSAASSFGSSWYRLLAGWIQLGTDRRGRYPRASGTCDGRAVHLPLILA